MKFDFAIGNPPYQQETSDNGRQTPVYNLFMDEAYKIADCVELITPARFLFNAGQTPKSWNNKILNDEHFKVLKYESDASKVFMNTEIKGGVAITIRDKTQDYGKIGVFFEFDILEDIVSKVCKQGYLSLENICVGAVPYSYSKKFKDEKKEYIQFAGESFDLRTNAFDKMYNKIFFKEKKNENYIAIIGIYEKKRTILYVDKKYIDVPSNFKSYKVILSKAQGSDKFGEAFAPMIIGEKNVGHTQTFISMGCFDTYDEAKNLESYLKTKFTRCLLSILKKTQDITPYKWKYVPIQNFKLDSDIDWSRSISEIDQQLYNKYELSKEEINFIETHVKEME